MITLQDVAKKAGVSPATVSRVVRGEGKVGDKCRAYVQKVIDEMGYRPNTNARALASSKAEIIGIITPNVSAPFYGSLVIGAEQAARSAKYKVLMSNSHNETEAEEDALNSFREQGCQNVILHSKTTPDETIIKWAEQIPGLIVMNRFIPQIASRCVWLDNISGGRMIAEHLIAQGHTKFAMITNDKKFSDAVDRLLGIEQALSRAGLTLPPENIIFNPAGMDAGGQGIQELLQRKIDFTALIAFNDMVAIGAINALWDAGYSVPEQKSVIGFDDVAFANICRPRLTTMQYPVKEMAKYAVELSIKLTLDKTESDVTKTHLFMANLIERSSIKKL